MEWVEFAVNHPFLIIGLFGVCVLLLDFSSILWMAVIIGVLFIAGQWLLGESE